jgi:L-threonylcarbamoyladenylate synthase
VNRELIQNVIDHAVRTLHKGGIILYPADTIWGIGCEATDKDAIKRIYEIKGRDFSKPFIVLVSDLEQLYDVAASVHPRVDTLLHFHERPLTVIYPQAKENYRHLASSNGSIAVRVVRSGICHELLSAYGQPLISTSANVSGEEAPLHFGMISSRVFSQVDYAFPAMTEKDMTGRPSVIATYDENGELDFLR